MKKQRLSNNLDNLCLSVRMTGLEPTRRKTLDPKSSAATNYATSALVFLHCKGNDIVDSSKIFGKILI